MQLDKVLLRSLALGIGMTLTTACSSENKMELDPDDCVEGCAEHCVGECVNAGHAGEGEYTPNYDDNCPACGMG